MHVRPEAGVSPRAGLDQNGGRIGVLATSRPDGAPGRRSTARSLRWGAVVLGGALLGACGGKELPTAVDCYAELPDNVSDKLSRSYRATPTRSGPVAVGMASVEQFRASDARRPEETDDLKDDVLEEFVGIAYDPGHADPTRPGDDWDPDYVFDVEFRSRLPDGFEAYGDHFEADDARTVYAHVDREGIPTPVSSLEMVIAERDCDRLVPAANDELVTSLEVGTSTEGESGD